MTTLSPTGAIGVFDSGVGGLTVYKALHQLLPQENFVYLGDTARLPYGTKSPETVTEYALQAAGILMQQDIKLLVVACNTASALALPGLQKALPDLPCLGVVEPGAAEAARRTTGGSIAVLATEGTVRSGVYADAIRRHLRSAHIQMLACNLMVGLAEEGWCEGAEAEAVVARYLAELRGGYDTLVLGCTHFPLLSATLRKLVASSVVLVDSAHATAVAVRDYLTEKSLLNTQKTGGMCRFMVTDSPDRFARLAPRFLDRDIVGNVITAYLRPLTMPA